MRGYISRGLRIRHRNNAYPERIIFWCFDLDALTAGLRRRGSTVS
jgi:hypothetical protein